MAFPSDIHTNPLAYFNPDRTECEILGDAETSQVLRYTFDTPEKLRNCITVINNLRICHVEKIIESVYQDEEDSPFEYRAILKLTDCTAKSMKAYIPALLSDDPCKVM